jgi:tetratricopeptide (TPR) repeat protein
MGFFRLLPVKLNKRKDKQLKRISFVALMFGTLLLAGCSTLNHNIGTGAPNGDEVASKRQWYILWGLVPLNSVDGGEMAKSKGLTNNYTIKSQSSFLDYVIGIFTSWFTVNSQTVKVLAPANASPASTVAPSSGALPALPVLSPENSLASANQALTNKDYYNALQFFQATANSDPKSAAAYQGMGTCYYYLGKKDQALVQYRMSLQLNPNNKALEAFVNSIK